MMDILINKLNSLFHTFTKCQLLVFIAAIQSTTSKLVRDITILLVNAWKGSNSSLLSGQAIQRIPADVAAITPASESSKAKHFSGWTPRR